MTIVIIGVGAWYIWGKDSNSDSTTSQTQNKQINQSQDPSESGKYLYIKEWGVRAVLPQELRKRVAYKILIASDPDTNLPIESADIFISSDVLAPNICATTTTAVGKSVDSDSQYIRSNNTKPFNTSRYRGVLKDNILKDSAYSYHLNYITPDCIGGEPNATIIRSLQTALTQLIKVN